MASRVKKSIPGLSAVVIGNVVPMRAKPDSKAEQISQALVGQNVITEAGQGDWIFVQGWDSYRGWVASAHVRLLADGEQPYGSKGPVAVMRELLVDIHTNPSERSEVITKATISAELEVSSDAIDWIGVRLPDGREGFIRRNSARLVNRDVPQTIWLPAPNRLVETAMRFVGIPYLWGGTSTFGLDCSGFVQLVYKMSGVTLLRDAHMQACDPRGDIVEKSDLKAGDIIFFGKSSEPDTSDVTHVGMMIDPHRFIHARSGFGVVITPIDDPDFTPNYWGARRIHLTTLDVGGGAPED